MVRKQVMESCVDMKAQLTREFEERLRNTDKIEVTVHPAQENLKNAANVRKSKDKSETTQRSGYEKSSGNAAFSGRAAISSRSRNASS